jgi:hypothetical protein
MGVQQNATQEHFEWTGAVPSRDPLTVIWWIWIDSIRAGSYNNFMSFGPTVYTGTREYSCDIDSAGNTRLLVGGTQSTTTAPAEDTWFAMSFVKNGSSNLFYYDLLAGSSLSVTSSATPNSSDDLHLGDAPWSGDSEWGNFRWGHIKIYEAALTLAEMQNEARSIHLQRTANLWGWIHNLSASDISDYSGNGNHPAVGGGTQTTIDGPPIPWRCGRAKLIVPPAAPAGGNRRRRVLMGAA